MSAPRVRYSTPPQFVLNYPECSACEVDLDHNGDGWECPKCGTFWDSYAGDGDDGELYADWTGEEHDAAPVVDHKDGPAVPWIEHPYVNWTTDDGFDMRRCRKCYKAPREHVDGGAR